MIVAVKVHGSATTAQPLAPGAVARFDGVSLLALDEPLLALRRRLTWSMGLDAHAAVDDAITAIATREPLLVVGPRGLDADVIIASLGDVVRVDLDRERLTAARAARLFATRDVRPVFRSIGAANARRVLDVYTERVRVLRLVPLAFRQALRVHLDRIGIGGRNAL